jgi:CBS domain-containing protein
MHMKVRDIMTTDVATATPDSTLEEVASMMKEEDTGAIPVVDDDELIGIITDRDIVLRCIAEGRDATETNVEDILSEDPVTIEPDADVEEAARIMSQRQIRRLPVVSDGELVGMVSLGDIAVKEVDEEPATEALEGVSRGVKGTRGGEMRVQQRQTGQRRFGKTESASLAEQEEIEEEIEERPTARRGEDRRSDDRSGREMRLAGQQSGQSRSGRATSNARGRASSGGAEGRSRFGGGEEDTQRRPAQSTRAGGISNRNVAQESSRQKKVTSARRESKRAGGRRKAS